jgi:hypothetical protein
MSEVKFSQMSLQEQATEIANLQQQYDDTFQTVKSILDLMNGSWSEGLASNFTGKIGSAQKSFSSILSMLANGSSAAKIAALSYSEVGSVLQSLISSVTGESTATERAGAYTAGGGGYSAGGGGENSFGGNMSAIANYIEGADLNSNQAATLKEFLKLAGDDPQVLKSLGVSSDEVVGYVQDIVNGDYKTVLQKIEDKGLNKVVSKTLESDWAKNCGITGSNDSALSELGKALSGGTIDLAGEQSSVIKNSVKESATGAVNIATTIANGGSLGDVVKTAAETTWKAVPGNIIETVGQGAKDFIMGDAADGKGLNADPVFGYFRNVAKEEYSERGVSNIYEMVGSSMDMVHEAITGETDSYYQNYYATHSVGDVIDDGVDAVKYVAGNLFHSVFSK